MNVFQKVTLQGVKKNRTRTVITIIGIILSVAMITGVATIISSFQNFLINFEKSAEGDWHVMFEDITPEFAEKISKDERIQRLAVYQDLGNAQLESFPHSNKRYINVSGYSDELFEVYDVNMLEGRFPENDREIVIPSHIEAEDLSAYEIGKTLKFELGDRISDGELLKVEDAYVIGGEEGSGSEEQFVPNGQVKEYEIVGICEKSVVEQYSAAGYIAITHIDADKALESKENIAYVNLKNPRKVYDFAEENIEAYTKEAGESFEYDYNSGLLRMMGVSSIDTLNVMMYSLGAILIIIIMVGSILLIYNAFSISVSERVRQFGIMSSVGATGKQLRKSVLFEGLLVGIVGIPLGLLAGIGGIAVTLGFINEMLKPLMVGYTQMTLHVSWLSIVIAVLVGILTIYISAYIPARKASRQSAIESIRQNNYVKINPKKIKTSKLVYKLFGLEGTIALKNLKRNKKRYRSTVLSLLVSIVLFITASSFGMFLNDAISLSLGNSNYDIAYNTSKISTEEAEALYSKLSKATGVTQSGWSTVEYFKGSIKESDFSSEYSSYVKDSLPESAPGTMDVPVLLFIIDDDSYREYVKKLGLNESQYFDKNINNIIALSNISDFDSQESRFVEIDIFKDESPKEISILEDANSSSVDGASLGEITITKFADEIPFGIPDVLGVAILAFAPRSNEANFTDILPQIEKSDDSDDYVDLDMTHTLNFSTDEPYVTADEMEVILNGENIPLDFLYVVAEQEDATRTFIDILEIFSYGFILLISLITIANVFNTISTNITLRRREFAMLKSVGMTDKGMNKMMNFECIFYGLKALLYGLPISLIISYLIYRAIISGAGIPFTLPWLSIGISVFSVFLVVFISMLYSVRKIKKENIIRALVSDN